MLGFGGALALLAVVALAPRLLDLAAGPDAAIRTALQQSESAGLSLKIPDSPASLVTRRLHFDRVTTHFDSRGEEAYALSTLDFEGTVDSIKVSSLGVERVVFERAGREWRQLQGLAPRLTAVIAALLARRESLESADAERLERLAASPEVGRAARQDELFRRVASSPKPRYRVTAWYIRLDRDGALVTEEYQTGAGDGRFGEEKGTRRLTLERRGSEFLFSGSLL
ncbi:MAG TPA: hypothetical protein VEM39_09805 [Myxococcaceae bacterium]|nr:hypothetical protein [Myxococcaceae bacterium]